MTMLPPDCQIAGCAGAALGEVRCDARLLGRGCAEHLDWFLPPPGGPPHHVVLADGTTAVPRTTAHLTATPDAIVRHLRKQLGPRGRLRPNARDAFLGAMLAQVRACGVATASGEMTRAEWVTAEVDLTPWMILERRADLGACLVFAAGVLGPDLAAWARERFGTAAAIGCYAGVDAKILAVSDGDPAIRFAVRYAAGTSNVTALTN